MKKKTAVKDEKERKLQHSCTRRDAFAFLREEVLVRVSMFVFQKRNALTVIKCH